jgi:glycosyltransferase family protein
VRTIDETVEEILKNKCSISRFGDGEFSVMRESRINFQDPCPSLANRLKEICKAETSGLLIGLPNCFGSLDSYSSSGIDFWRKWMAKYREKAYSFIDMKLTYYDAFFSRPYTSFDKTNVHYKWCKNYFEKVKEIWANRDIVICEGKGTRFGMFNDLLNGAKSISRILCPARNAFNKYDEILSAFDDISQDTLILCALGPTATVLAYDLYNKGYQAIDIGHLDVQYELFLRKETKSGFSIKYKYVDNREKGRKVEKLVSPEYESQIIKKVL